MSYELWLVLKDCLIEHRITDTGELIRQLDEVHDKIGLNLINTKAQISDVYPAPWQRYCWLGESLSADSCFTGAFELDDVMRIVAFYSTGAKWDGETAGVAQLNDKRNIAWEAVYGPTGNGFSRDAYGGTSDIVFAYTIEAALSRMTETGRSLICKS